jgi:hypothetical protein
MLPQTQPVVELVINWGNAVKKSLNFCRFLAIVKVLIVAIHYTTAP